MFLDFCLDSSSCSFFFGQQMSTQPIFFFVHFFILDKTRLHVFGSASMEVIRENHCFICLAVSKVKCLHNFLCYLVTIKLNIVLVHSSLES